MGLFRPEFESGRVLYSVPGALLGQEVFPLQKNMLPGRSPDRLYRTEVEVNLRPTVSRPVCPGVRRESGTRDQYFFLLEISF
jgi:hypothetical protein